jgi:predicted HicB family RNase H-like nuclease
MKIDSLSEYIAKAELSNKPKHSKMLLLPISPELHSQTKAIAEANHMSASSFIRQSFVRNIKKYADEYSDE